MSRSINRHGGEHKAIINGTDDKYVFKYKANIRDEEYHIQNLTPYCCNCTNLPLRMTSVGFGDFKCNCEKEIGYQLCRDVESRIITNLELSE